MVYFIINKEAVSLVTKCVNVLSGNYVYVNVLKSSVVFYIEEGVSSLKFICDTEESDAEDVKFTLKYEGFATAIKNIRGDSAQLSFDGTLLRITAGNLSIELMAIENELFPEFLQFDGLKGIGVSNNQFKRALDGVLPAAVLSDHIETFANCLYFENAGEQMNLVATDGHRMAVAKLSFDDPDFYTCVMPKKSIYSMRRIMNSITNLTLYSTDRHIIAASDNLELYSSKLDRQYIDYQSAILEYETSAKVGRQEFLHGVNTVADILTGLWDMLCLEITEHKITVYGKSNKGSSRYTIECSVDNFTGDVTIGMCAKYLKEALAVFDCESVSLMFVNNHSPICIKGVCDDVELMHTIMPRTYDV